jgi:peptidyl-tRNA hydrolase
VSELPPIRAPASCLNMATKVVVSGFGAFGGVDNNPTEELVACLLAEPPVGLGEACVLEVSGAGAAEGLKRLQNSWADHQRVVFLHLGVHGGAVAPHFEACAYNVCHFRIPDQRGWQPQGEAIDGAIPLGSAVYTSLNLTEIDAAMRSRGFAEQVISVDPGRFICNFVYYLSVDACAARQKGEADASAPLSHSALFLHLPPFEACPKERQLAFVCALIEVLAAGDLFACHAHARAAPALFQQCALSDDADLVVNDDRRAVATARTAPASLFTFAAAPPAAAAAAAAGAAGAAAAAAGPGAGPASASGALVPEAAAPPAAPPVAALADARIMLCAMGFTPDHVARALRVASTSCPARAGATELAEVALPLLFSGMDDFYVPAPDGSASAPGGTFAPSPFPPSSPSELKAVLVVRTDLKMGPGKVAAQCVHAALGLVREAQQRAPLQLQQWEESGEATVVLRVDGGKPALDALRAAAEAAGLITHTVADAGRTQVEAGSQTVMAIGPAGARGGGRVVWRRLVSSAPHE